MIPFSIQTFFFRALMFGLKLGSYVLPFREPQMFRGPGASLEMCREIARNGHRNLLVVTDAMLVELGLLKPILAELETQGVKATIYDGVKPDPTIEQIETGLTLLKSESCTAILAVGGGSSIDAAKVIAARATDTREISKMAGLVSFLLSIPRIDRKILPLFAVPTTAGTGSEVTIAAVVSDPARQRKLPIMDLKLVPKMAALDASLMTGLPPAITAATGMDALTHAVEAYISRNATGATDAKAIEATRLIMDNLPTAYHEGGNLEARQNMSQASFLAGIAFTRAGVGYVHAIAHNFGARYHTPHGLANAIVMPHVLDYSKPGCIKRLADLARACKLDSPGASDADLADAFIAKIRAMNAEFGIPSTLDALRAEDIPAIADAALSEAHSTYAVPRYMDKDACQQLIRTMLPA